MLSSPQQSHSAKQTIQKEFQQRCAQHSDINEHLPTLERYAKMCSHITECGVRSVVSSWAFACGLAVKESKEDNLPKLISVDPSKGHLVDYLAVQCKNAGINFVFHQQSDLACPLEETDLLFIDTWHVYGQLKRELARWHQSVRKFIILHDTTIDEWMGEAHRYGYVNIEKQSEESGIPIAEIKVGLWPAVTEFLENNKDWKIKERFTNNNGLTVLERVTS